MFIFWGWCVNAIFSLDSIEIEHNNVQCNFNFLHNNNNHSTTPAILLSFASATPESWCSHILFFTQWCQQFSFSRWFIYPSVYVSNDARNTVKLDVQSKQSTMQFDIFMAMDFWKTKKFQPTTLFLISGLLTLAFSICPSMFLSPSLFVCLHRTSFRSVSLRFTLHEQKRAKEKDSEGEIGIEEKKRSERSRERKKENQMTRMGQRTWEMPLHL